MPWTCELLNLTGGSPTAATFQSARITWQRDGGGSAEIELRDEDVSGGAWLAGRKRVRFKDSGATVRYQGWMDALERAGRPSTGVRYRASAVGLAEILEKRAVHGDFTRTSTVATTIAWDLINHAQGQTDGNHGFTLGTITGTAPARTRYFCDGDIIGERIREISELETGGFDWEIDAAGAFNAWVGGRGTNVSGSVTIAPSDTIDWRCRDDVRDFATYATGLGDRDDDTPCGAPLVVDFVGERTTYGRREVVLSSEQDDVTELELLTSEELRARVASRINLQTSWVEGQGPWAFGTRWLGDTVTAALGAAFGGNTTVRCTAVEISLEATREFVTYEWEKA